MDKLEQFENGSIDKNNCVEIKVIDEILDQTNPYLGLTLKDILLNKKSKKYKEQIISILNKYNYNRNDFYFDILIELAIRDDLKISTLTNGIFINDIVINNEEIIIDTIDGKIIAFKLAQKLNINYLNYRFNNKELLGRCHELTRYMCVKFGLNAATSFLQMGFGGFYIHSYNYDNNGHVIDTSHNLIMSLDDYNNLVKPHIISSVSREELVSSISYEERFINSVEPLYNIALSRFKE